MDTTFCKAVAETRAPETLKEKLLGAVYGVKNELRRPARLVDAVFKRFDTLEACFGRLHDSIYDLPQRSFLVAHTATLEKSINKVVRQLQVLDDVHSKLDGTHNDVEVVKQLLEKASAGPTLADVLNELQGVAKYYSKLFADCHGRLERLFDVWSTNADDCHALRKQVDELRDAVYARYDAIAELVRTNAVAISEVREDLRVVDDRVGQLRDELDKRFLGLERAAAEAPDASWTATWFQKVEKDVANLSKKLDDVLEVVTRPALPPVQILPLQPSVQPGVQPLWPPGTIWIGPQSPGPLAPQVICGSDKPLAVGGAPLTMTLADTSGRSLSPEAQALLGAYVAGLPAHPTAPARPMNLEEQLMKGTGDSATMLAPDQLS